MARALVLLLVGLHGFQAHVKGRMALAHVGLRHVGGLEIGISLIPSGVRSAMNQSEQEIPFLTRLYLQRILFQS